MSATKLITLLSSLKNEEWSSLGKCLAGLHQEASDVMSLYRWAKKHKGNLSNYTSNEHIRAKYFSQLKPKAFANLQSKLYGQVLVWMAEYDLNLDTDRLNAEILISLNRRGLHELHSKEYRRMQSTPRAELTYDQLVQRNRVDRDRYYSNNTYKYEHKEELIELSHNLQEEYALVISLLNLEHHNWSRLIRADYSDRISHLEALQGALPHHRYAEINDLLQRLVRYEDKEVVAQLFAAVRNESRLNADRWLKTAYAYIYVYCKRYWTKGLISDPKLIVDIFQYGLTTEALYVDGLLSDTRFRNIVNSLAALVGRAESEAFIEENIDRVTTVDKEELRQFCMVLVCYAEGSFAEISNYLISHHHTDPGIKIKSAALMIVSLCEDIDQNYDLLLNRIENFRRLLAYNRDHITDRNARGYRNLADIAEKLLYKKPLRQLMQDLASKPLVFRAWGQRKEKEQLT